MSVLNKSPFILGGGEGSSEGHQFRKPGMLSADMNCNGVDSYVDRSQNCSSARVTFHLRGFIEPLGKKYSTILQITFVLNYK
jgi:hypothetical protein